MKSLTYKETTSILAALRHLQDTIAENGSADVIIGYPHFDDVDPLTVDEIDDLCESINCGHTLVVDNPAMSDLLEGVLILKEYVSMVARLDTSDDFEQRGSVIENDDAIDTVDRLISEARDLVPRSTWDTGTGA